MSKEGNLLGITEEAIEHTHVHVDPFIDDEHGYVHFIRGTMMRVNKEQPELYGYIRDQKTGVRIHDPFTFSAAAAITYDMLPESHRFQVLGDDEIQAAIQSIHEDRDESGDTDLGWYIDKLRQDSPDFADWLGEMVSGLETQESKSDFIFGVVLISLPFYMRSEAAAIRSGFQ